MNTTTHVASAATLTEAELFQHLLTSPMRQNSSASTLIEASASAYQMIDLLPKCCESTLFDEDIAEVFSMALLACEEDPAHELKMIIWFLEELLDSMRVIQKDFDILKESSLIDASVECDTAVSNEGPHYLLRAADPKEAA